MINKDVMLKVFTDFAAARAEWVGHCVFLPALGIYAGVFDITSRGEVGLRFSSVDPNDVWDVWARIEALGVEIVLAESK